MIDEKKSGDTHNLDINIGRIATFVDAHIASATFNDKNIPPFSSVEFSINGLCNRRCKFCPRVDVDRFPNKDEHLSCAVFQSLINQLADIQYKGRISFSGFSEPLLTKDIEKYIEYARKVCPTITIEMVSNGDFATPERLKSLFEAGLDNIRISVYDGLEQEAALNAIKKELCLSDEAFILRNRYQLPKDNYGLVISNRAGAINLDDDGIILKPLEEPLPQACYYPFYKMLIDYDCTVYICSNDWLKKYPVGDVSQKDIVSIWNGDRFHSVRQKLIMKDRNFVPCKVCDVNGLYNGDKHFQAWVQYYDSLS